METYHLLIDQMSDESGRCNADLFVVSAITFAELNN